MLIYELTLLAVSFISLPAPPLNVTEIAPITIFASPHDYLHGAGLPAAILPLADYVFGFHLSLWGPGLVLAGVGFITLLAAAAVLAMTYIPASSPQVVEAPAEAELNHSLLFENNPYPAWVFDRETLAFLAVNEAAVLRYGHSREEFLQMTIKDIYPSEELPRLIEYLTQKKNRTTLDELWKHRKKDGSVIYAEITSVELSFRGRSAVLVLAHDVTERVQAEEALRRSEERNRAMLKAIPDLVLLMSKEGVYLDYHAKDVSEIAVHPDDFLGKNVRDVVPPEVAEDFITRFDRAIVLGETQVYEFTIRGRIYETRIVSCEGDKILIIARDVTAHKKTEAQRTLLLRWLINAEAEERARLAREVHDEFAAYLTALKWGLESLGRAEAGPAPVESKLLYLRGLTTQLQQKVHDFAFELSPAELNDKGGLPAALDQYVGRWAELAGGRLEVEFRAEGFDAGPARPPREIELALYRVAQEALTNVLKHAAARHVAVTLSFEAAEPGRKVVRLSVQDDGVGFEPTHEEVAERGLGLKGISERVALVGGTLEVSSGGEGTCLSVSVPFSTPHGEEEGYE